MWQRTKHGSKASFDKLWGWADKLGAPVNRLSNKLGSEAFWPTTLDKESDKAARILRSFCSTQLSYHKPVSTNPSSRRWLLRRGTSHHHRRAQAKAKSSQKDSNRGLT